MIKTKKEIEILLPIDTVMDVFQRDELFKHWQKGLIYSKSISKTRGKPGSKRKMKIKVAGTIIHMEEEITTVSLPDLWEATYRTSGVINFQSNRFRESVKTIHGSKKVFTIWQSTSTFKFTGIMRILSKTNPTIFTSQSFQHMKDFKTFAEGLT